MGVKYTKRGVLFGAEGNLSLRSDFAELEITDGIVEFAGTAVPVVFGTRYVDPVVTGWDITADFATKFYNPSAPGVTDTVPTRPKRNNDNMVELDDQGNPILEAVPNAVRMTILTMRWVLCLGQEARIARFQMNNEFINVRADKLPGVQLGSGNLSLYNQAKAWEDAGAVRIVVTEDEADVFGGGESGGLGYPWGRLNYSPETKLSEFWLTIGFPGMPTNEVIDRGSSAKNVVSLYFDDFNFGGRRPIPKAKVAVQRYRSQTAIDKDGRRLDQWQTENDLHTVGYLRAPDVNPYYLFVLDSTLTTAQREKVRDYVLSLPYDESGTQYQIIRASYYQGGTRVKEVVEDVINEDGDREQTHRNLIKDRMDKYVSDAGNASPTRNPTSFDDTLAKRVVQTYATNMFNVHNRRNTRSGVVTFFLTDIFRSASGNTVDLVNQMQLTTNALWALRYPNAIQLNDQRYDYSWLSANQLEGLKRFQPETHLVLWEYIEQAANLRYRINTSYTKTLPDYSSYLGFRSLLDSNVDILVGGGYKGESATVNQFFNHFQVAGYFGWTMNPVHALREALTNPDWGEAVPYERINEADFLASAKVCKEEGLAYCYVHKQLGGVDRMVTGITDYIDAFVWYDGYTDSVRMNLIREDYDINNLPTFDESSIAGIENYRRVNTNELTNSVTVKYHDAALGSSETVTVHDLEASFRAGGVVAATFNYDGCATLAAATRAADRELVSLSRSIITFTVKLHTGDHVLGLGDPIVISYRDLGLQSAVMRVTRILYGDGTTGGISVDLVQDVFADLKLFGDIVEVEPYLSISEAPPFVRLDAEVLFLEQSYFDITSITAFDNPHARWLKAGVKYNPDVEADSYVSIDQVIQNPSIGTLLTEVPVLAGDPRTQSIWIQVRIKPAPTANNYVRIGNEIFKTGVVRLINDNVYEILLTARAQRDTVATNFVLPVGTDVWFLDRLWLDQTIWDGSLVHALFHSGVHNSTELLRPDVDFVSRGNLPQPPAYVTVNNAFGLHHSIDGAFTVRWKPRNEQPALGQTVEVTLSYNDAVIFRQSSAVLLDISGQIQESSAIISLTELNTGVPSGVGIIQLQAKSVWEGRDSWQSWDITIDWSALPRNRCGYGYSFGANWGGSECGGWGRDFDEQYGN